MDTPRWMIYGANGYTGALLARQAKQRQLSPILAGRRAESVAALANELGLEYRVFGLDSQDAVVKGLAQIHTVVHCAGPFSATSAPMIAGCLESKTHYLDITGEISVFEAVRAQHHAAVQKGVVIMPGVGFDVVPTDCLALTLKNLLPDATSLILAFQFSGGPSSGTAKSMVEGLKNGGKVRQNGEIIEVPFAYRVKKIPFVNGSKWAVTIPWGDVSTAYYTTGIPNIEVYMASRPLEVLGMMSARLFRPILSRDEVQQSLKSAIDAWHRNPSETARQRTKSYLWGQVTNARGEAKAAHLVTPNGYDVTVTAALGILKKVLSDGVPGGVHTPASVMRETFITSLPGTELTLTDKTLNC